MILDPATDAASGPRSTAAPPPRGRAGRVAGWLFVGLLLVGIALVSMRFVATSPDLGGPLNPESPGPGGAKALAELVRDVGVDVEVTRSRTEAASSAGEDATLVLTDPSALTDEAALELIAAADRVVLLTGGARMLRLLDLGEDAPASPAGVVEPACDTTEFARVGTIDAERMFVRGPGSEGCFRDDSGAAAVLTASDGERTVSLVAGARMLSNAHLAEHGHAALGVALLAQRDRVVWYVPTPADGDIAGEQGDTLGTLTPGWLTPAIVMLLLAGIAAVWWRGRRFGPLVAEALPVTVRASETMHGRARLTAKTGDAAHAADAIRAGTRLRLARRLALGPRAGSQEVADAASDRLRIPRGALHDLLGGAPPESDRDLIDLARRLSELETAVDTAVHTERNLP